MKNDRLPAIIDCFLLEGKKTAQELAERFEVSIRTIYRDIDSLCAAGIPLVSEQGKDGGYSLVDGYRIDRSFLSPAEVSDLGSILAAYARATKDRNLESTLGKISALGSKGSELIRASRDSAQGQSLPPALIADLAPWGTAICDPKLVGALRRAIAERRVVEFEYVDGHGQRSARAVEPFSLVVGGATWYVHGWCRLRSDFRLFKLSRVREVRLMQERYDPGLRAPVPQPFAFEQAPVDLESVLLSVEEGPRQGVEEAFPGMGQGPDERGRWSYRFEYPVGAYLVNLLLFFGPGIRVEAPESLRRALAQAARKILESNDS